MSDNVRLAFLPKIYIRSNFKAGNRHFTVGRSSQIRLALNGSKHFTCESIKDVSTTSAHQSGRVAVGRW